MAKLGGITIDEIEVLEVDQDPSVNGIEAPLSSIALLNDKNNGASWLKTGPVSTDWSVLTSTGTTGSISQASLNSKLTKGSHTIFCIDNGDFATGQAAIDAASAGDTIIFGNKSGGWGNLIIPAGKTLSLVGLTSPKAPNVIVIGSINFSPTTGNNPIANELHISNLFIAPSAGTVPLIFGGTAPARLRVTNCYFYSNNTSNVILSNTNNVYSSAYFYDCQFSSQSTSITHIQNALRFVHINRSNMDNGNKAILATAGLLEMQACRIEINSSSEIITINNAGTVVNSAITLISNSTTNGSGVLIGAGAAFQSAYNTFSIATGTGYCVRGTGYHLYGPMLFANNALVASNVKVQNTLTNAPFTTTFTLSS